MIKLFILIIICIFAAFRASVAKQAGRPTKFLLISCFVQTIPFGFGKSLYEFIKYSKTGDTEMLGAFGSSISLETSFMFAIALFFMGYTTIKGDSFSLKKNIWTYLFLLLGLVSFFNPINPFKSSVIVPVLNILQLLFLLNLIKTNFTRYEILKGTFDGLMISTFLQLGLAICYPVLGIEAVATLFKGENALAWTTRREGYKSATGTFSHPGNLALYCLFSTIFFLSCYFNKYRAQWAKYLILINLFIIFLTFSRTTYVAVMAVMALVVVLQKRNEGIFSLRNIVFALSIFAGIAAVLYLTPLADLFLKSDAESQVDNRLNHWILGFQVWNDSKWIGVGINSHVYYMSHQLNNSLLKTLPLFDFLVSNPIHNVHVIVLVECGVIGIVLWFFFFINRINRYSRNCHTPSKIANIYNMTFVAVLTAFFVYGFFGWTPFGKEIYGTVIFFGYFTHAMAKRKGKKVSVKSKSGKAPVLPATL